MTKGLLTLLILAGAAAAGWYLPAQSRHHHCETGVVYATDYLTLHVPGGVVGFPPGTRFVERFNVHIPDKEVVSDGKYTLAVDPLTLTHDIEYAQELASSDQASQDQTQASLAQRKARIDANRHAAELGAARDIDGVNAVLVSSSAVGNYDTALRRPASIAGAAGGYGSYGGGGGYAVGGGGSSSTSFNNVTVTQNIYSGASAATARGGTGPAFDGLPGKVTHAHEPVSGLSAMPMNP